MPILAPLALALSAAPAPAEGSVYERDVAFALDALEQRCGDFFELKGIDWKAVREEMTAEAAKVDTDAEHWVLLTRLLARLKDGHAEARKGPKAGEVQWPIGHSDWTGPGMFLCRSDGRILIKNAWNDAAGAGLKAGYELLKIDGAPAADWLARRQAELSDLTSFSTEQQAFGFTCHWGLAAPKGTRITLECKDEKGRKKERSFLYTRSSVVPWGPAVFPKGLEGDKDVSYCFTEEGYGYVHLRRCPGDLPERIDAALAKIGKVKGLVLDFRANGGGGFDHDAFMGRFVPEGKRIAFGKAYESAGPNPYGGPIVAIVDANCRSAGETAAGIFKEDGRAYLIGETPTAGMSSSKETIELPSGLFSLYVSVASNKGRFNGGRGIEGIGVVPHEIVEYDPKDLADGVDTLTARAEALLKKYPKKVVPYDPKDFGWR